MGRRCGAGWPGATAKPPAPGRRNGRTGRFTVRRLGLYTAAVAATATGCAERAPLGVRRSLEVSPNVDPMRPNEPPRRRGGP